MILCWYVVSSFPSLYDLARIIDAVSEGFNTESEVAEVRTEKGVLFDFSFSTVWC